MTIIADFISRVQAVYKTGAATEHSYRSALETLFNALADGTTALNEPKRVACGAPDFIVQRGEIIVGHSAKWERSLEVRTPTPTPMSPPSELSVMASMMN